MERKRQIFDKIIVVKIDNGGFEAKKNEIYSITNDFHEIMLTRILGSADRERQDTTCLRKEP